MDANRFEGSQNLKNLAERLRLNNKPIKDLRISDSENLVVSRDAELTSERFTNLTAEQQEKIKTGKSAAVLICLFEGKGGDIRVILTKRSSNLSSHSGKEVLILSFNDSDSKKLTEEPIGGVFVGEVALPGGKVEDGDASYAETALREAKEEIGLDPSLVTVVTCLEPFVSKVK